jgi:epoxyqueuosine reductase
MDAARCISYLTIEKKGGIDEDLRAGMGRNVFGCDICQEVCPWNRRAPISSADSTQARSELVNPPLEWLAAMDSAEFKRQSKGSPLERTGRKRLQRNLAIAMGNSGESRFLLQLDGWAAADAHSTADRALRDAADWARGRIRNRPEASDGARLSASLVGDVDRRSQPSEHRDAGRNSNGHEAG